MEKINIADLLKDCPKGMELDCTICNGVKFIELDRNPNFPIVVRANNGYEFTLTRYGQVHNIDDAKCVIFPKGKTTWEGFVPPCKFKDGDIVYIKTKGHNHNEYIIIFKEIKNDHIHKYVCFAYQHLSIDKCALCHLVDSEIMRLATEEEKQKLFDAIKSNGYKWNPETKTLEKLIQPKFKVGDRIRHKVNNKNDIYEISKVYEDSYGIVDFTWILYMKYQDNYELAPNKFDISTLKPFDKVLVRDNNVQEWIISFFSHCNAQEYRKYSCVNGSEYAQCVPYEENKHLLRTTNNCEEFYKTWEK